MRTGLGDNRRSKSSDICREFSASDFGVCDVFFFFRTRRRCTNGQPETVSFCHSLSLSLLRRSSFVAFASKQRPPATAPLHIIIYSLIIASFHNDIYYTCTHSNVNLRGTTGAPPSGGPIKK